MMRMFVFSEFVWKCIGKLQVRPSDQNAKKIITIESTAFGENTTEICKVKVTKHTARSCFTIPPAAIPIVLTTILSTQYNNGANTSAF